MIKLIHTWNDEEIDKSASIRAVFEDHYENYTKDNIVWQHMLHLEKQGFTITFDVKDSAHFESCDYTATVFESKHEEVLYL